MSEVVSRVLAELATFPGRDDGLKKIKRYHIYKTLYYRSSDFSHSKRVAWLLESIEPLLSSTYNTFDMRRALTLALVHDDAELMTGDHQAGNKRNMTPEQLAALEAEEREAIRKLASTFPPTINGYSYEELLFEVLDISTLEAQVVKYLDRFDAMGEALNELYAGNSCMNTNVTTEYGLITLPFQSYYEMLPRMLERYPALGKLKDKHVFFEVPAQRNWAEVVAAGAPHTAATFAVPTGHPQYDEWKRVMLMHGDSEEIKNLYTQVEFL